MKRVFFILLDENEDEIGRIDVSDQVPSNFLRSFIRELGWGTNLTYRFETEE